MRSTELFKENIKILKPRVTPRVAAHDPAREALHMTMTSLLEEILDEDSTVTSAVRNSPYADALIKVVHKELAMPHDLQWQPEDQKITWAEIKSKSPNYVLVQGQRGTGAIKWNGSRWEAVLANKERVDKITDSSITDLFKEIKNRIGASKGYWSAVNSGKPSYRGGVADNKIGPVDVLRTARRDARTITRPNTLDPNASREQNIEAVLYKLRPLYAKYIEQAIANIKGVTVISLKNDAYDKVKEKTEILVQLAALQKSLVDKPNEIPQKIKEKLRPALYMTSSHYYPDDTGHFTLSSGYRSRSPERSEGQRKVISDIANGDQKKLVTLMNYLKQSLLHP